MQTKIKPQRYVVNKLLRYLRWSNLVRRHFRISHQDPAAVREEPSSDSTNDLTDSEESCSSDRDREKTCPHTHARPQHPTTGNLDASTATPGLHGPSLANGNGHGRSSGEKNGRAFSNSGSKDGTPGSSARQTDGYTFSDRGTVRCGARCGVAWSGVVVHGLWVAERLAFDKQAHLCARGGWRAEAVGCWLRAACLCAVICNGGRCLVLVFQ